MVYLERMHDLHCFHKKYHWIEIDFVTWYDDVKKEKQRNIVYPSFTIKNIDKDIGNAIFKRLKERYEKSRVVIIK